MNEITDNKDIYAVFAGLVQAFTNAAQNIRAICWQWERAGIYQKAIGEDRLKRKPARNHSQRRRHRH